MFGKFGISFKSEGINCRVVEVVKNSTLRWFGHLERMGGGELTKEIYKIGVDAVGVRGSPPIKWKDRVLEYLRERGWDRRLRGMVNARVECMDRSKWRLFCHGHPLKGVPRNRCQSRLDQINYIHI